VLLTRARRARGARGHSRHTLRLAAGGSGEFSIASGGHALVAVRLDGSSRGRLLGHHRLRLTASVFAARASGGSAFGHPLVLRLTRR
jgi:hypothetical protein